MATGLIISETLKPIFHQAIQFALGTFQIIFFTNANIKLLKSFSIIIIQDQKVPHFD